MTVTDQLNELLESVNAFSSSKGVEAITGIDAKSELFLNWIPYLNNAKTGVADELLDAAVASLREAAACAGLGLVRAAIFAMRTEIDLILSWLYFKDHAVEWEYVNSSGDGFKLKKEILEYLVRYYSNFNARHGILKEIKKRTETDPYRLLSAHIHSQSLMTLPLVNSLKEAVGKPEVTQDLIALSGEVDEYISDILFSAFASGWSQIPPALTNSLESRFKTQPQKQTFYTPK